MDIVRDLALVEHREQRLGPAATQDVVVAGVGSIGRCSKLDPA